MSKNYNFSTGNSIELSVDGLVAKTYVETTHYFKTLDHVFIKMPGFLSKGHIAIEDTYVEFAKKDVSLVLDLENKLSMVGVVVARYRKESDDSYIEEAVSVGGVCSFITFANNIANITINNTPYGPGKYLIYHRFGKTYKIYYEDITQIIINKGCMIFYGHDGPINIGDTSLIINLRRNDYKHALLFAQKLQSVANHIEVEFLDD